MEYKLSSVEYYSKYSLLSKPNLFSNQRDTIYTNQDSTSSVTQSSITFKPHLHRKNFEFDDSFDSKINFCCLILDIHGGFETQCTAISVSNDEFGLSCEQMYPNPKKTMVQQIPYDMRAKPHSVYSSDNIFRTHYFDNLTESLQLKRSTSSICSQDFNIFLHCNSSKSVIPKIMSLNEYHIMYHSLKLNFCLNQTHIKDLNILENQIQDQLQSITLAHNSLLNLRKCLKREILSINEREVISHNCFEMLSERLKLIYNRKNDLFKLPLSSLHSICEYSTLFDGELTSNETSPDFECITPESLYKDINNISHCGNEPDRINCKLQTELSDSSCFNNSSPQSYCFDSVRLDEKEKLLHVGTFKNPTEGKSILSLKLYGYSLFVASAAWVCYRFDICSGFRINTYSGHKQSVTCMEILVSKFKRLYTGSSDKTIRCYDITTANCLCVFTFEAQIMCVSISSDTLFVGLSSGIMPLVDLTNNILLSRSSHHKPKAISYIYSTRDFAFTGSFDCSISIYKIRHCNQQNSICCFFLKRITNHKGAILTLCLRGDLLYSGSVDRTVIAYDVNKCIEINKYTGHELPVSSIQVLVTVLITACLDKKIRIFHIHSSELLQTYIGYSDQLFSMSMRKNIVYTGSKDGTIIALEIDLSSYFQCLWSECMLSFSSRPQINHHILEDHINILEDTHVSICGWGFCQEFFSHLTLEEKRSHILSHTSNLQQKFRLPSKSELY